MNRTLKYVLILCLSVSFTGLFAQSPVQNAHDNEIMSIFQQIQRTQAATLHERIRIISKHFLDRPYHLGPLGEGSQGKFDQHPLYRTDQFDCLTYLETVIALAMSDNLAQFKKNMVRLRYRAGHISFIDRNHFMSVDWNKNNEFQGLTQDMSYRITNKHQQPVAKIANTIIDKPSWYRHKKITDIKRSKDNTRSNLSKYLSELQSLAKQVTAEKAVMLYIPLSQIIKADGSVDQVILQQIPDVAIIQIVRPNWALKDIIGTNLHVSHVGLSIRTQKDLLFRHASSKQKKVVERKLIDYLRAYKNSKTVKGINIHTISLKDPS